ncbi:29122_t:CDS:2 [Racocetra persica]|uniref:29122_t:CDS:1 n=1 Tax=Racocetra persica TaxID=160502 RepID=A0ACA9L3M4_9GLOM|nr:29122_t:CDS:2 [Racocetra persica]
MLEGSIAKKRQSLFELHKDYDIIELWKLPGVPQHLVYLDDKRSVINKDYSNDVERIQLVERGIILI